MEAFLDRSQFTETAQHIVLVQRKLDRLIAVRDEAWRQLLTAAARAYRQGYLHDVDLPDLLSSMKDSYGQGFTKLWNSTMPRQHGYVQSLAQRTSYRALRAEQHAPNSPSGTHWIGQWPPTAPYPQDGQSVVYVLYDAGHEPVYVGSTGHFLSRMYNHRIEGTKQVTSWMASPCTDREEAYRLEEKLLGERMPKHNRRRTR